MEKILLNIVLLLAATKVGGIISRKVKMPEVLGALVAGVLLGPVFFNAVEYDGNIKLLSDLGVILLMFLAGLQTNVEEFKKAGTSSLVIAIAGIFVPLVLGTFGAYLFYNSFIENLFIGVILTATSVSITVETLTELGKLNTRAGINILGAAVIDDILGLILISVILAVGNSKNSGSIPLTLLNITAFCFCAILLIVFLPGRVEKLTAKLKPSVSLLTFSIALALLAAFIAEKIGIAAITGAYLCGMLLSQFHHREYLERGMKAIASGFLSPIFFASIGLTVNLSGFNRRAVFITFVMFFIAVFGKVTGCGFAARLFRMSRSESLQIGAGMISRGEVAVITANIGLQNHLISQEVFLPVILVVILTTIAAPVALKLSFSHKYEKRVNPKN